MTYSISDFIPFQVDHGELSLNAEGRYMTSALPKTSFRDRLISGDRLVGTFIKTPTTHATEIIGDLGFDFIVIDEEHAPFDRLNTDNVILAARAVGIASLVRVPSANRAGILSVLDCGAAGVLVPHIKNAELAADIVSSARYRGGSRGIAMSTRAGRYGSVKMTDHIAISDAETIVIAMIEDPEALSEIDAICATDGLDALFIGRGDLASALGVSSQAAPEVTEAVDMISRSATSAGKKILVTASSVSEARILRKKGASAFVVSSDQGFLRRAAAESLAELASLTSDKITT